VHRATQREPQTIATEFRMKRSRAERSEWISSQRLPISDVLRSDSEGECGEALADIGC